MKKIIHYHFDTAGNIGDAAVVLAIQDLLIRKKVYQKYTSSSIFNLTEIDSSNYFLKEFLNNNLLLKNLSKSNLFINFFIFLIKVKKYYTGLGDSDIISFINSHDLMIVGGGGVYSKWVLPFNLNIINNIKIPIVIFAAGYNSNYSNKKILPKDINSIFTLNKKAVLCSVRDNETLELVRQANNKVSLIGDPAIFLKSKRVEIKFPKNCLKIGINISCHETHTYESAGKIVKIYNKLINELSLKNKIKVYYLKHGPSEEYAIDKLKQLNANITVCEYGPREMKYIYENLDLVISMMLHSSIFAYGSNTKFINIAYDIKNYSFMSLINNKDNLIDIRNLSYKILIRKVRKLLSSSRYLTLDKNILKKRTDKFIDKIKKL